MTHIAIQERLDGKVVDWMEQVSDEHYLVIAAATGPPAWHERCKNVADARAAQAASARGALIYEKRRDQPVQN